jgi:hypothetical protein
MYTYTMADRLNLGCAKWCGHSDEWLRDNGHAVCIPACRQMGRSKKMRGKSNRSKLLKRGKTRTGSPKSRRRR